MEYSNYCHVDTASNGPQNRNNIQDIRSIKYSSNIDCYKTYFRYPDNFMEYFKKHKSVKGYSGFAYADWFPIDIDNDDLGKALDITRDLVSRLEVNFDLDTGMLPIFFSGAKGFHIYIPAKVMGISPSKNISHIFRLVAKELLDQWSIKYDQSIYDLTRLFRSNCTINSKTGLYKIPLEVNELYMSIEEIKDMATSPRKVELVESEPNESLVAIYAKIQEDINNKPKVNGFNLDSSAIEVPKNAKLCYYELLKGVGEGGRDASTYRLTTYFRKLGYDADITNGLMQAWNNKNQPPLPADIITAKVKSAYSENSKNDFGCNDEILKQHCKSSCYFKNKGVNVESASVVYTYDEYKTEYEKYTKSLKEKCCQIGLPVIGPAMRGIAPGEVCTIVARSGVGKTLSLLNIMMRIALSNNSPQLFFTMEQPAPQIYERMAQMACRMSGKDIETIYAEQLPEREKIAEKTRLLFEKILLVDKDFLTVEKMIDIVRMAEEQKVNGKIGVVTIDYIGRMSNKGKDSYAPMSEAAQAVKHMAKELNVAVIQLAQVNRSGKDGTEELRMDMIRDSGQIEEASDFIIGMWRPDMKDNNEKPDDKLRMKLLKNRKGPSEVTYDFKLVKKCLRIDDYLESMWMDVAENERVDSDSKTPNWNELGRDVLF